jgi:predicted aminopeptidase
MKLAPLLLLCALVSACSPAYVLRAGWEEAQILARRKPIARIVADPATDSVTRRKLVLVQDARLFARDSLGLKPGDSYTLFSRVHSDTLAMVLSAAEKDRFQAHTWWFPIVGRVPYKGYFDPDDAARAARELEAKGYDAYVRPTAAFSTLGWFNDPLLSSLLRYDDVSLGNTVVHEITHNTFFAPGQVAFNESFANFVGGRGAVHFFCAREGAAGPNCREAAASWEDDVLFGQFLEGLVKELEALYARPELSREDKIREREVIFTRSRQRFTAEVQPRFKTGSFAGFTRGPLNNATLIARRIYYDRLELFDRVYRSRGGDLRRTVADVMAAARANKADPYAAVAALVPAP